MPTAGVVVAIRGSVCKIDGAKEKKQKNKAEGRIGEVWYQFVAKKENSGTQ